MLYPPATRGEALLLINLLVNMGILHFPSPNIFSITLLYTIFDTPSPFILQCKKFNKKILDKHV